MVIVESSPAGIHTGGHGLGGMEEPQVQLLPESLGGQRRDPADLGEEQGAGDAWLCLAFP